MHGLMPLLAEGSVTLTTGNVIAIIAGVVIPLVVTIGTAGWKIAVKLTSIDMHLSLRLPRIEEQLQDHDEQINNHAERLARLSKTPNYDGRDSRECPDPSPHHHPRRPAHGS